MPSVVILNALFLAVGLLIFFATVLWTLREMYVHEFRFADMHLFEYSLKSEISDKRTRAYYQRIATQWLHISEDYRRTSLYLSMMVANMVFSIFSVVSATVLLLLLLLDGFAWLVFLIVGLVFLSISLLNMLILYGRLKPLQTVEKFSWWLAELFPPLVPFLAPSHLARGGNWKAIQDLIDERTWLRKALTQVRQYEHLRRLFGYGDPKFFEWYCGRKNPYIFDQSESGA